MELREFIARNPEDDVWDVVVIGTGAGGATAGFNLARLGRGVLFLERGKLHGLREVSKSGVSGEPPRDAIESGWWPDPMYRRGAADGEVGVAVGCGVGGSTAVFGMVLDRFRPVDFTPRLFAPQRHATALPDVWPIEYSELEPHYRAAEALYRVRGTVDPLTPPVGTLLAPPVPSGSEFALQETLHQSGLHPYGLHLSCERISGCDGCLGRLCTQACRNDAARICVLPALEQYGAKILPECRAISLETTGSAVSSVICMWNGRRLVIRGRTFVLALHALLTPALLLRSANETYPDGLGNSSGLVGRNLMWHVTDHLLVRSDTLHGHANEHFRHGLSLNDFYVRAGVKLGNIHAHAGDFKDFLKRSTSLPSSDGSALFHTIVEDFPYPENRVTQVAGSDDAIAWEYNYPAELRARSEAIVSAFADALHGRCEVTMGKPSSRLNGGHACGTCRFGTDPRTSVLDRDNRIHDLDNAYVVDASFFPSSGGINPSLTVIANSLRVSEAVAKR
jgi:choline dehydrogenase-like flavoprotein